MASPRFLAKVQRDSLLQEIVEALDKTEAVHRGLQKVESAHVVDLRPAELVELSHLVETAYNTLAEARALVDGERWNHDA